ncbi:MAG: hypothetical protein WA116_03035 [Anaerolineaceae bacterium]
MNGNIAVKNQPNIKDAIAAGFKSTASHVYLIFFPIILDLYLLFSPRYTIYGLVQKLLEQYSLPAEASADLSAAWAEFLTLAEEFFRYFSVSSALRTLPVGVPSLLSGRVLTETPFGSYSFNEITSWGNFLLAILVFSLVGILLGTVYFQMSSSSIVKPLEKTSLKEFGKLLLNIIALPALAIVLLIIIGIPVVALIIILNTISSALGMFGYIILGTFLISVFLPLFFTPHAVIMLKQNVITSLRTSIKIVQSTYSQTSFFIVLLIFTSYVSNLLWQSPPDDSWMMLVGIFGHALVSTALISASFHYFHESIQLTQADQAPVIQA